MKIYTERHKEFEDSVEVLLKYQELKGLVSALTKFEEEVQQFKTENTNKTDLGFTHLHLKDCNLFDQNSKADIVFYVDLNE